jgi:hypothetical protein
LLIGQMPTIGGNGVEFHPSRALRQLLHVARAVTPDPQQGLTVSADTLENDVFAVWRQVMCVGIKTLPLDSQCETPAIGRETQREVRGGLGQLRLYLPGAACI